MRIRRIPRGVVFAFAVLGASVVVGPPAAATTYHAAGASSTSPAVSCGSLTGLSLANTVVNSAVDTPAGSVPGPFPGAPPTPVPETCRVHATVTSPGVNDQIGIDVWMPVSGWNGRFQGVGGGGYSTGSPNSLAGPVAAGFSAAVTDGGHTGTSSFTGSFALTSSGHLNWPLIEDFSYRGLHDLAVVGKAVTAAFFGTGAKFSYWNGCSTGGRQGLAEAQRYPQDYNGILSAAPAINWQKFIPAELWPELVMVRGGDVLPQCKLAAFQTAAINACDKVGDGVADGVIGDPLACRFDPATLVGTSTPCGTITAQDAAIVARIVAGPRTTDGTFLWYGLTWGTSFSGLANTTTSGSTTVPAPFPIALAHLGTWVQETPPVSLGGAWDWTTTTFDQYDQLFQQSVEMYSNVIGTDNPDLSAFKKAGGKLVIWHGQADQLIFPQGSINYYQRVADTMGGVERTRSFARLFLAPGVGHCAGGPGPQPDSPLSAVIDWVEHGKAPQTLNGVVRSSSGAVTQSRPICLFPSIAVYKGHGDPALASSFVCRAEGEQESGR
jgi:Tannase and feruloyl esterase